MKYEGAGRQVDNLSYVEERIWRRDMPLESFPAIKAP